MEVDWAGKTLSVYDQITGIQMPAYVFVATLPCSLYSYAEAFPSMVAEHWINAHIHAYTYFGGVTRIVVPDNLKTSVIKHGRTDLLRLPSCKITVLEVSVQGRGSPFYHIIYSNIVDIYLM